MANRRAPVRRSDSRPTQATGGLADALFTKTKQRVLLLLFGQPHRSYLATELIRLAGVGSGAVQRELKRLTNAGLVTVTRVGNQRRYSANPDSPIFDELCGIVVKTVGLVEPLRAALRGSKQRIRLAIVYGSIARGTDTATSDIDLLLVSDGLTLEETYAMLGPTEERLGRRINPTMYTVEEFERRRKTDNAFLSRVLGGEHIVLLGDAVGA